MKPMYDVMVTYIIKRGIRKTAIAKAIGLSPRALNNKLCGKSKFTWNEVCVIQSNFFPDISKDELMAINADKTA